MTTATSSQARTRYRFSVDEYQRMGEVGIFGEDDRVELIDGEILEMSPIGELHMKCVNLLNRLLVVALGEYAIVSIQNPIVIGEHDEPQPDVAVLRPSAGHHPGKPVPGDVVLLIEVADSTLAYDRDVKLPLYARAGVPEAWLVDLHDRAITRYTVATDQGYRVATICRSGEVVESTALPVLRLAVDDILP